MTTASSTEPPFSHRSTSSAVIRITGMSCSWMGWTTPLGSVVMIE
jgi:hypothetical protein